jgi:hypothetical protein
MCLGQPKENVNTDQAVVDLEVAANPNILLSTNAKYNDLVTYEKRSFFGVTVAQE